MLPVIRTFISLPAGVARMPFWKFTFLSIAGIIPWVLAFALVGNAVGDRWDEWQESLHYGDYVILAGILGGIVYLIWRRRRSKMGAQTDAPVPDAPHWWRTSRRRAVALGVIQGPTEPARLELRPSGARSRSVGWRYRELDPGCASPRGRVARGGCSPC
jgi:hypothetical protein